MNTILVVEDGLTDMQVISLYLQQEGYTVMNAKSAEEAEQQISKKKPDMIFLDVVLPDKSGFEICREIKDNPNTSSIPVVFCSTKNSDVDKTWGTMLGADDYLAKPINREELVITLKKFVK